MDDETVAEQPEPAGQPTATTPTESPLPVDPAIAPATRRHGDVTAPVVIDLGRRRRREIDQMKRGEGPLVAEVEDVVQQVRAALAEELDGKTIVPIVMAYKTKGRKRRPKTRVLPGS